MVDYEFFETPETYTAYLLRALAQRGERLGGTLFEPCVGSGAILRVAAMMPQNGRDWHWITNDLDPRWPATQHGDATYSGVWQMAVEKHGPIDWTITNPAFTPAIDILRHALAFSREGVAMHLRASIHEVLKTGPRRTFMAEHPPTGILWLPRFAYQRSKSTGKWTTDNVGACWAIWLKRQAIPAQQFIEYAPEWVIDALDGETLRYRTRMDRLMAERAA